MLDKIVGTFGALFVILLFTFCGTLFVGLIGEWYAIQNEAQFLAQSQGKYGGYTQEANTELQNFVTTQHLDGSRLTVQVSASGAPVFWGTPVHATVTYNFPYQLGQWVSFDVPIAGRGRAVSTYLPGAYNVNYTSPSW